MISFCAKPIQGQYAKTISADPKFMALTLAEVRTVAWLVENDHFAHLESLVLSSNLDMSSVSTEVETIKRVVDK